jgi:hypothetical protein
MAKNNHRRPGSGGARSNAGRPVKKDKTLWGKVTCVLRLDTIAKLKAGVGRKSANPQFGEYLQYCLDRHPFPSHEQFVAWKRGEPFVYYNQKFKDVTDAELHARLRAAVAKKRLAVPPKPVPPKPRGRWARLEKYFEGRRARREACRKRAEKWAEELKRAAAKAR